MLKILADLLSNDKNYRLKEVFGKFRLNQKISVIQRNFLKNLFMWKVGRIMIAFKTILSLPEPKDYAGYR